MRTLASYASILDVLVQRGDVKAQESPDALRGNVVAGSSRQYACSHGNHKPSNISSTFHCYQAPLQLRIEPAEKVCLGIKSIAISRYDTVIIS